MKAFGNWVMAALCLFGAFSAGAHFYLDSHPRKILVILDSSFPMSVVWDRVPQVLASLEGHRYTRFALASEKGRIHGWQTSVEPGRVIPYAPRDLADLRGRLQFPEAGEASEVVLITNAHPEELSQFKDWKTVRPEP